MDPDRLAAKPAAYARLHAYVPAPAPGRRQIAGVVHRAKGLRACSLGPAAWPGSGHAGAGHRYQDNRGFCSCSGECAVRPCAFGPSVRHRVPGRGLSPSRDGG